MKKELPIVIAIGGFLLATQVTVLIAAPTSDAKSRYDLADANGDSIVTAVEYADCQNAHFKEMDTKGLGKLSRDELWVTGFEKMDINKDGAVTEDEYLLFFVGRDEQSSKDAKKKTVFEKMDGDGDGKITKTEAATRRQATFKETDTNGDGKINKEELSKYHESEFKKMDTDSDGFVTIEEFILYRVPKRQPQKK